ncbi:transposase [Parasphingopyxis algicola]|uniref:transposase n=1 Tax=Parasphingopyxis algicola TaxID=2026624 RepID=UPI0015A11B52|nr:transposase [Parasphingopyxis algicola]QLC26540.1 transposase [Parasphingopyxis algicola]
MPLELDCPQTDAIDLDTLVDAVETVPWDVRDEDSFAAFGPHLKRLANDPKFLADIVRGELETRCAEQARHNRYGVQVVMLHRGEDFFVRANFWPSRDDSLMRSSGERAFFYDVPHDHNFSFLTVGYAGPGYRSDYYEYDYDSVAGYPGETAGLRLVQRSRLTPGRVLLYRAHRDIHCQLPPEAMSVSLNIIGTSPRSDWSDQYRFDPAENRVAGLLTTMPSAMLMRLTLGIGGAEGRALVHDFARRHPSDHVRFDALAATLEGVRDPAARRSILERGAGDTSRQLAGLCRDRLARLDAAFSPESED